MSVLKPLAAATVSTASARACRAMQLGAGAAIVVTSGGPGPATGVVIGELDLACADGLAAVLCSALDEYPAGIRLDLSGVEFFDCAALHAFERAERHGARHGRRLVLERSSTAVDLVLGLMERLGRGWPGVDERAALASRDVASTAPKVRTKPRGVSPAAAAPLPARARRQSAPPRAVF